MRRVTVAMSQVRDDAGVGDVAAEPKAADLPGGVKELGDATSVATPPLGASARVFGVEPDVAAIVLVYFVQGALGLSRLATRCASPRPPWNSCYRLLTLSRRARSLLTASS